MALIVQTTVRYRDLDKVKATLETWKRSKLKAARIFVEMEDVGWNQRRIVNSAVLAMEAEFARNRPVRGLDYCLLVNKNANTEWKNPYAYLDELMWQRDADLNGPRNSGRILRVNGHGITIQDTSNGKKYFVFYTEVLKPDDALPPPLFVGTRVSFVPANRTIRYTPIARCVRVEVESANVLRATG